MFYSVYDYVQVSSVSKAIGSPIAKVKVIRELLRVGAGNYSAGLIGPLNS